ncbi:O-antigen ligase family protein [Halobium palmae]|uniref:O-antigen ligase family protein n=1 Tax=Halobium palmae TaxID=1776492 RepID=A0ABD5RVP5_9EURY
MRSGCPKFSRGDVSAFLSPSDENAEQSYLLASLVLVSLLTVVVPLFFIVTDVPALLLISFAGVIYAALIIGRDIFFEGVTSALFVFVLFNANVPLISGPGPAQINLLLVDVVLIPTLLTLLYQRHIDSPSFSLNARTIATACLGVFVLWSFVSAVVSNGQFQSAGLMFGVSQLRNLLILLTSTLVIRRTSVWCGIYPLVVSVGGNLLFAIAEVFNGSSFGLTYLGEVGGGYIETVSLGITSVRAGLYAGAYVGSSRTLVAILILVLPIAAAACLRWDTWGRIVTVIYVVAGAFLVRVSATDAGLMALLLSLGLSIACLLYYAYRESEMAYLTTVGAFALGIAATVALYASRRIGGSDSNQPSDTSSDNGGQANASGREVSGTTGSTRNPTTVEEQLIEILSAVPIVNVNNLSIRLQQYAAAIQISIDHPLFGIGGHNFNRVATSYGLPHQIQIHNTFFAYLVATGIPGLLAYLGSILVILTIAVRRAVSGIGNDGMVWGLIAAGMVGFHAFSFWTTVHSSVMAYGAFWAVSGLVIGYND